MGRLQGRDSQRRCINRQRCCRQRVRVCTRALECACSPCLRSSTCVFVVCPSCVFVHLSICRVSVMCVCSLACLYTCMFVHLHVCSLASLYTCTFVHLHVCTLACLSYSSVPSKRCPTRTSDGYSRCIFNPLHGVANPPVAKRVVKLLLPQAKRGMYACALCLQLISSNGNPEDCGLMLRGPPATHSIVIYCDDNGPGPAVFTRTSLPRSKRLHSSHCLPHSSNCFSWTDTDN